MSPELSGEKTTTTTTTAFQTKLVKRIGKKLLIDEDDDEFCSVPFTYTVWCIITVNKELVKS